jgi:hypothetical protein
MRKKVAISIGAAVIVAALLLSSQEPVTGVVTLNPHDNFGVSATSGDQASLVDVYGRDASLYFLFASQNREIPSELIRTDTIGNVQLRISLPLTAMTYRQIRAGPNGVMAVLASDYSDISVLVYDGIGRQVTSVKPVEKPYDIQFMGPTLLGIGYQYVESLYDIDSSKAAFPGPISLPSETPFWSVSVTDDLIGIISATSGVMRLVSRTGVVGQPIKLSAPEMRHSAATESGDEALIHTVASSANGDIFCGLTSYRSTEGGMIARFDKTGRRKGGIRCILPKFQELVKPRRPGSRYSNPTGYLVPDFLAVTEFHGLKIYWADSVGKKVVSYELEE